MIAVCIIQRRQEDSGQRQLPDEIEMARSRSYERHLTNAGIRPDQYEQVYELAIQIYNEEEGKGPFGVDYLLRASKVIKRAEAYNAKFPRQQGVKLLASGISCDSCKGTKLSYKFGDNGEALGIEYIQVEGKRKPKPCEDCL